jgi:hypothetical protein
MMNSKLTTEHSIRYADGFLVSTRQNANPKRYDEIRYDTMQIAAIAADVVCCR